MHSLGGFRFPTEAAIADAFNCVPGDDGIAGCASAASDAFPFATATRGCTQEDAPALEIYLTHAAYDGAQEPSPPYLRIEIASTPAEPLRRAPMTLVPLRREAFSAPIVRAEYVGLKREHAWLAGTVTLTDGAQADRWLAL